VLDHLAEIHRQISLNTPTSVNQTKGVESVIAAVIDAPAVPRAPQSQSIGEQIWVAIPILNRQEMVGGLALGYPGKARDLLAGRMILELALRLLLCGCGACDHTVGGERPCDVRTDQPHGRFA
jgi:hypothetical protein